MRPLAIIGVLLVALGVVGFILGGFSLRQEETAVQVGDLKLKAETEKHYPIPPWANAGAIVIGLGLVVYGLRRR